jgi:uncharacterized delta-60 repeat protein
VVLGGNGSDFEEMKVLGDDAIVIGRDAMIRYDESGVPAAGFGIGGEVDLSSAMGAVAAGLGIQPDGKIVVAGRKNSSPRPWVVARFDGNGALDPTFGTNGIAEVSPGGSIAAGAPVGVGFQQNGADLDIVVAGDSGDQQSEMGIVRLNPDGSLDTGFGISGKVFENQGVTPEGMDVQSDGRILVYGTNEILRYTADGVLDGTFGSGGRWTLPISADIQGIKVLPDDDILVMGEFAGNAYLYRLTPGGALDGSFAGGGLATYDFGLGSRFFNATQDASGRLILVGHYRSPLDWANFLVVRMSAAGVLDSTFGHGGYAVEHRVDEARDVAFDTAGRLLVAGAGVNGAGPIHLIRHIMN